MCVVNQLSDKRERKVKHPQKCQMTISLVRDFVVVAIFFGSPLIYVHPFQDRHANTRTHTHSKKHTHTLHIAHLHIGIFLLDFCQQQLHHHPHLSPHKLNPSEHSKSCSMNAIFTVLFCTYVHTHSHINSQNHKFLATLYGQILLVNWLMCTWMWMPIK